MAITPALVAGCGSDAPHHASGSGGSRAAGSGGSGGSSNAGSGGSSDAGSGGASDPWSCTDEWAGECPEPGPGAAAVTLASSQESPSAIATDDEFVYWSTSREGNGLVLKTPLAGGSPVVIAQTTTPGRIEVANGRVYWANAGNIMSAPTDGGTATLLAQDPDPSGKILDITVDRGTGLLYWSHMDPLDGRDTIRVVPLAGGPTRTLVILPEDSFNSEAGDLVRNLAVDESGLYWTTKRAVMRADLDGANVTELASAPCHEKPLAGIAIDATHVYWVDWTHSRDAILKMPKQGGEPVVLSDASINSAQIVVDDRFVYSNGMIGSIDTMSIVRTPKDGGCPTTVVAPEPSPMVFVARGERLFYLTHTFDTDPGAVKMVAK